MPKRQRRHRQDDVDEAYRKVRAAPAFHSGRKSRGPLGLEIVLRAVIHDYLRHSRQPEDVPAKQVRLRDALRRVAAAHPDDSRFSCLALFNTKPTPLRLLCKALWDGCDMPERPVNKRRASVLRKEQDAAKAAVVAVFEQAGTDLGDGPPPPPHPLLRTVTVAERSACRTALVEHGIVRMPGLVSEASCRHLLSRVPGHFRNKDGKFTPLTETMGLGARGAYFDSDWSLPMLKEISHRIMGSLGLELPDSNTKSVLLGYAEGGENWAHQDDNKFFKFQALLMLSQPQQDFTDGGLYVLNGDKDYAKVQVDFANRGDVVVFRSNDKFFHGMARVGKGEEGRTARIAVGLFHRLAVK